MLKPRSLVLTDFDEFKERRKQTMKGKRNMGKARTAQTAPDSRWMRYKDMTSRYGLGRNTCIKLAKDAQATRKIGKVVIIDSQKVDEYLEKCGA